MASELLKRGANLETNDNYGCTPLLNAVKYGAPESIVDILLKHGANVHAVSEDGKTVLHFAAQRDNEVMMRKLIERNLSPTVNAEDIHGRTPLHDAAYCGSEAAAMVLTEKGVIYGPHLGLHFYHHLCLLWYRSMRMPNPEYLTM